MHILKMAYHIIGPVSRLLQGISIDLASAAALLSDCKRQFEQLRTNADTECEKLNQRSATFTSKHGIACELSSIVERRKRKKRMDGELATDESLTGKERLKVETFVTVIDEINEQLRSRFSEQNVTFMTHDDETVVRRRLVHSTYVYWQLYSFLIACVQVQCQ
jgi:hypothetical protein